MIWDKTSRPEFQAATLNIKKYSKLHEIAYMGTQALKGTNVSAESPSKCYTVFYY